MPRFLTIVLIIEVALGLALSLAVFTVSRENWGILYILFLYACSQVPLVLLGLWALLFRPPLRATAAWVSVLPVAFLFLPMMLRTAMGGEPVSSRSLLTATLIIILAALVLAFTRPQVLASKLPRSFLHSKGWNVLLLLLLVAGWCIAIALLLTAAPALLDTSSGQGSPGMAGATLLIIGVGWLVGLAAFSLFVAAWGWLGLRGARESPQRKLYIAQLALASPGLLVGLVLAMQLL